MSPVYNVIPDMKGGDNMRYVTAETRSKVCCEFLERVFRLRIFSHKAETEIVDRFLQLKSIDELVQFCKNLSAYIINKTGRTDLFSLYC